MPDLISKQAKLCYTAAGQVFHDGKLLLVKHRKLGFWLAPGGHLDPEELPHLGAEREVFEETGIRA
ncbi:NUDIX domain-containing protein, partial [Candidatus Woesebacteria bacterium]|nr:NUDIX domain-containing protein [Candidatus Woesebacteria bacterium]